MRRLEDGTVVYDSDSDAEKQIAVVFGRVAVLALTMVTTGGFLYQLATDSVQFAWFETFVETVGRVPASVVLGGISLLSAWPIIRSAFRASS